MTNQHQLFDPDLVDEYLGQQIVDRPSDIDEIRSTVENWISPSTSGLSERNLQQSFNQDIFAEVLGYELPRPGTSEFQLFPEQLAEGGGGFPDILLGQFEQDEDGELETDIRKVVGELKGPGTDLDKVDPSRLKSPVEQAFDYAITNGLAVRWVVASNMEVIRLYHHGSIDHYQEWEIERFVERGELTDEFWEFYFLLHQDYLIGDGDSVIENLLAENLSDRLELTEEFYDFYRHAVEDVYSEIADEYPELVETVDGQVEVVQASQKLIHRGLVICFFSDHPSRLLPDDLLADVIEAGKNMPTLSGNRIYPLLKDLFRALDEGSTENYPYDIFGYDGGLFEEDAVLSEITLPDNVFTRDYEINGTTIEGVLGFHQYDFQKDLNEHVLGRIFEESVGDIERVRANVAGGSSNPFAEITRGDYGLFFTREVLTEFVAQRAIQDLLQDKRAEVQARLDLTREEVDPEDPDREFLEAYLEEITNIRIVDIACGSGAFLVSCFNHLSREARNVHDKLISLQEGQVTLESFEQTEIEILDQSLHGNDILQEAVEISKLSVWLRSARKDTSLAVLTGNFESQDALAGEIQFEEADDSTGFEDFDLVIGNPPWGGEIRPEAEAWLEEEFSEFDVENLDTYELFVLTALKYVKPGGRLAFVLPHTLANPDHEAVRTHLLENHTLERYHLLGADWFGPDIRMSTTTLQLRKTEPVDGHTIRSMTLVDDDRRKAISGELSLSQLESAYAFDVPQQRCIESGELEPFRYVDDDKIISKMEGNSIPLGALCDSYRGVELNKAGHIIQCPSCGTWLPPPVGRDPDSEKTCTECGLEFEYKDIIGEEHIVHDDPDEGDVPYIHGDSFGKRYEPLEMLSLDLGYDGIKYKDPYFYDGDTILIRKTGVGLSVAYTGDLVYCPQTVYIFQISDDREQIVEKLEGKYSDDQDRWIDSDLVPDGLDTAMYHKFIQGVLSSRVFHYYIFKRFAEVDAAQAFAHVTLTKIRSFPIPVAMLNEDEGRELVQEVAECVDEMVAGGELGGGTDWRIEQLLRELYGLTPEDMQYVNEQMGLVAYHKAMQELYPDGPPSTPERKAEISVAVDAEDADEGVEAD